MSDDNPPPKKKSRFFSDGKSKIGNILHPFKRNSQREGDNSTEQDANDDNSSGPTGADNGPPLLSKVQPLPPLMVAASSAQYQPSSATSTSRPLSPRFPFGSRSQQSRRSDSRHQGNGQVQGRRHNSPPQPHVTDSEAETELEASSEDDEDDEDDEDCDASDEENVKPGTQGRPQSSAQDRATTRQKRREAVYGLEALLPPGSNANGQQGVQGSSSIFTPAPPSNSYTFGGVPTNHYVTAAGGQYLFNFRTAQAPTPPTMHQPTLNTLQHPMGSGLARFAQNPVHNDTGPLNQLQPSRQNPATPNHPIPAGLPTSPTTPYIDTDRDEHGRRLRLPRPPAHHGIYAPLPGTLRVPAHLSNPDSLVPEHMYTSPNRIERAQQHARISLKRKRPDAILPPTSYVYQRTGNPEFNIFHGFLLYPELCFALASHLPVKDLISLYAISKDFHVILDTRFTTAMLSQATAKAPESARTYMFRSYAHLCRSDPAARIPHPNTMLASRGTPRRIPSFRWLKMVLHREKVIHELLTVFAEDGVPLPARCSLALKRLWFMLDIPDNARRIGFIHNRSMMTDLDLYFCACFFTKMDMRLNDPISGEKRDGMRKLLLAQRSFTTVLRVLKREMWTTRFEVLREWVRLKYVPAADEAGLSIFGVPADRVGKGRLEYWGLRTPEQVGHQLQSLLRPDQLVIREVFKRGMRFEKHYLRFMLYGYVRPDTLENYAPRTYGRRIAEIKDDEYEVDDVVGGVAALGMEDEGFDPLLDLGQPREVSRFTIIKEETSKGEREMRKREEEFLDKCIEWWVKARSGVRS